MVSVSKPAGGVVRSTSPESPARGFSPDFRRFLEDQGYGDFDFAKPERAAFGGRTHPGEKIEREPVILVHGQLGHGRESWRPVIDGLLAEGYRPSEIYALTYGPGDQRVAALQYHSKNDLQDIDGFIQAVLDYTGRKRRLTLSLTRSASP